MRGWVWRTMEWLMEVYRIPDIPDGGGVVYLTFQFGSGLMFFVLPDAT